MKITKEESLLIRELIYNSKDSKMPEEKQIILDKLYFRCAKYEDKT